MAKVAEKSLVEQMRSRLNEGAEKPIAKIFTAEDTLLQIDSWIPLKAFFKKASGGEGFPCGHITQIIGKPDSGKTTLMMEGMVTCQKAGGIVFLIDSEHKFSLTRLKLMGGKPEEVVVMQVDTLEDAWTAIQKACEAIQEFRTAGIDAPMMLCWDSVAASVPKSMLEGEAGDAHVSLEAKINNKNVRRLRNFIKITNVACVFINHYYWTMPKSKYEQPELVIKGGEELYFFSTLVIKTKQGSKLERGVKGETQKLGRMTKFEVIKGHFHGRTIIQDVWVVDVGILQSKEEFDEYKMSLRGEF